MSEHGLIKIGLKYFARIEQTRWYIYENTRDTALFAIDCNSLPSYTAEILEPIFDGMIGAYNVGFMMGEKAGERKAQKRMCDAIGAVLMEGSR